MSSQVSAASARRPWAHVEFALGPLDDVAHASTAPLGVAYTCLQCCASMAVVRAGSLPHFRHVTAADCDGSAVERQAAARLLVARLSRERSDHGAVTTWSPCNGPGRDEPCPDGALMPMPWPLPTDGALVSGAACPPPADVAIVRGGDIVLGFELVPPVTEGGERLTAPERTAPQIVRLALGDVLAFRALMPLDHDAVTMCCAACRAWAGATLAEGAVATSEFLDAGFVREAMRVHAMWFGVIAAAEAESATESASASRRAREAPSTTRRRRIGPW